MSDRPCGPQIGGIIGKVITFLAPQKPFGVDIRPGCRVHDKLWLPGANKAADKVFRAMIKEAFEERRIEVLDKVLTILISSEYEKMQGFKKQKTNTQISLLIFYVAVLPLCKYFTQGLYYSLVNIGRAFYKLSGQ